MRYRSPPDTPQVCGARRPMSTDDQVEPEPPRPPATARRVRLPLMQRIGIPLLLLAPVVALTGALGETRAVAVETSGAIELRVDYPTRVRHGRTHRVAVAIHNRSSEHIDTVHLAFDTTYVDRFARVVITPSVDRAFEVALTGIAPSETRVVFMELDGDQYGQHHGHVRATSLRDAAAIRVQTFTLP